MDNRPARSYTRLAIAIVVAAVVIGAGFVGASYLGTARTSTAIQNRTLSQQSSTAPSSSSSSQPPVVSSPLSSSSSPSNATAQTSTVCFTGTAYYTYTGSQSGPAYSVSVSCYTSTEESFGNMTLHLRSDVSYSLPANFLENSSITSRILDSFYHALVYLNYNDSNPTHASAVFNVTGTQLVQGNWTDGYHITYTDNELVNVSATLTTSSTYMITHVAQYPLPDRSYTDTYTSQQQEAILAALSNSTARSDMAGSQYYVYAVNLQNTASTIQVAFFQVDGRNAVAVNLDDATLKVVQIFTYKWDFIGPLDPEFFGSR